MPSTTTAHPTTAWRNDREADCVFVVDKRTDLIDRIGHHLTTIGDGVARDRSPNVQRVSEAELADRIQSHPGGTVVFSPLSIRGKSQVVNVDLAKAVVETCRHVGVSRFVLISSAEVNGAHYSNPGLLQEKTNPKLKRSNSLAERWRTVEALARKAFDEDNLVVLRPCCTLSAQGVELLQRLFTSRIASPLAGYDPSIQLLGVDDLATAVAAVIRSDAGGIYNVAPDETISLRKARRIVGSWSIPLPYTVQRLWHRARFWLGYADLGEQLDFLRYSWTVSNEKIKDKLGFRPRMSSAEALAQYCAANSARTMREDLLSERHDDFGMDEDYIRSCSKRQLGFMDKVYWRIETEGLEHFPMAGGGVLAGLHRGFMPFDGVMIVHLLSKHVGRVPRFLMHPGLVKFPYLATFLTRLGGVIACQENADRVLRGNDVVAVFPEGIRGAFRMYDHSEIYRLDKFRDDYVKFALRHQVPIIPFVTIGPAETFPILGKVNCQWWKRYTHWPFFPITPTWPFAPIPLPTKWHVRLLPPIATEDYPPDAANDRTTVRELSDRVRRTMQTAIDGMRSRRKSHFFGSIFDNDRTDVPARPDAGEAPAMRITRDVA